MAPTAKPTQQRCSALRAAVAGCALLASAAWAGQPQPACPAGGTQPCSQAPGVVMLQRHVEVGKQGGSLPLAAEAAVPATPPASAGGGRRLSRPRAPLPCRPDAVEFDFGSARLVRNNLGGQGPQQGAEEMRLMGVVQDYWPRLWDYDSGAKVDLVITAKSPYTPQRVEHNGLQGEFASINLAAGASVDLTFSFQSTETRNPVRLPSFAITFFDLDQGGGEGRTDNEAIKVSGFEEFVVAEGHELAITQRGPGEASFGSTRPGKGCDNPTDPMDLGVVSCHGVTVDRMKRSVMLIFRDTASFDVSFTVGRGSDWGRNVFFSGASALARFCPPFRMTTATTTTTGEREARVGTCVIWGDPHINGFDSNVAQTPGGAASAAMYDHGDYWLVRTPEISLQARYWSSNRRDGASAARALAVGGAFLQGHRLVVEPMSGRVTWDGEAVLTKFPSTFEVEGLLAASFDAAEERLEDGRRTGAPVKTLDVSLPHGVRLTVNRWAVHVDAMITMSQQPGGQDGHCGNFDGDAANDATEPLRARMGRQVPLKEDLFVRRNFSYVGCFRDELGDRDLPSRQGAQMKLEECALACQGSEFFGRQWMRECFCGDSYGKHGRLPEDQCACDAEDIGDHRNCVYKYDGPATRPAHREVRVTLEDCPAERRTRARALCRRAAANEGLQSNGNFLEACTFDVCFAGDSWAAQGAAMQGQVAARAPAATLQHPNMIFQLPAGAAGQIRWAAHPSLCLGAAPGADGAGENLVLGACEAGEGGPATRFQLPASGLGQIHWEADPEMCLDVASGGTRNGTNIQLWRCDAGHPNMQFSIPVDGGRKGHIHWARHPRMCLDVDNGGTAAGTNVHLWHCE